MRIYTFHCSWPSTVIHCRLALYGKSLPPSSFILSTFSVLYSPSYFFFAHIILSGIDHPPCDSHQVLPKHCFRLRTENRAYHKQKIHWFFATSVHFFIPVLSFSLFSCNHFQKDGLDISRAEPCSSISSLSHSTFLLDVQSSTDE